MPYLPSINPPSQTKKTYFIVSELLNLFQEEKFFIRSHLSLFKALPVTYALLNEKLFAFFFFKTRVIRIDLSKSLKGVVSFFIVSNSGSKISVFKKDKTMVLMKISSQRKNLVSSNSCFVNFEQFCDFQVDHFELTNKDPFCFNPNETILVAFSEKRKFITFDLEKKNSFSIELNKSIQEISFPISFSSPNEIFGKTTKGVFFGYNMTKKR